MFKFNRNAIALSVPACLFAAMLPAAAPARAASYTVSGIQPFNPSLGTLDLVEVTIDPLPALTSTHTAGFGSIDNHNHLLSPAPLTVSGIGTFYFPTTPTNVEDSAPFGDHEHIIDPGPATKFFGGANMAWFLNPANTPITSVPAQFEQTDPAEGHTHSVVLGNHAITTTFQYTVPEPGSAALLGLAGLALARCRR